MRRSHFAAFLGLFVSLFTGLVSAVLRLDLLDHRDRLELDQAARNARMPSAMQRFKAFVARAFEHDRYSAGRFHLGRSTAT
ncbi:hypothetical protein [Pelagibacterium lacus]|uniref:Uncharacterized protein n=1 Tax=Pelagibacterium lacus TaxID=2282655 RepID=A0A369W2Y4_9HYPH|nr:hypothetical protein [Pelagibacterium lacus]RDE07720.1 hypothetical protein DVH29_15225 [Pelagibacterium lacus]